MLVTKSVAIIGSRGYPSYYGGFETLVRRLAPYLVEDGWQVSVYGRPGATLVGDPAIDPRVQTIETCGVESKSFSTLSYGLTSSIHAAIKNPDVALVLNVANGYWLPILKARGIPTMVNVDGIEWERAKWGKGAKAAFKTGAKLTAKFATQLVADSVEIEHRWERDFGRSSEFIPYGGESVPNLELPLGLPPQGYVLMVARFVPENTVSEFLDAAERLSAKWPVIVVGSSGYGGEIEARLEELANRFANITWLGHVNDDNLLFSLWENAGVYFHGHSVGGTNPALVQAMACGAPIVARDTKYNREVLGDAGIFTEPNPKQIESTIDSLISDGLEVSRLRELARRRAEVHYAWPDVCRKYSETLLKIANAGSSRTLKSGNSI